MKSKMTPLETISIIIDYVIKFPLNILLFFIVSVILNTFIESTTFFYVALLSALILFVASILSNGTISQTFLPKNTLKLILSKKYRKKSKQLRNYLYETINQSHLPSENQILSIQQESNLSEKDVMDTKKEFLDLVVKQALADQVVNNQEIEYIAKLSQAMNIEPEDCSKLNHLNVLFNLLTGEKKVTVNCPSNLKLGKSERLIFATKVTSYEMSKKSSSLFFAGLTKKVDLGFGIKLRLGAIKFAKPTKKYLDKQTSGELYITNKNIIYVSPAGGCLKFSSDKIASLAVESDMIYLHSFNRKSPYIFKSEDLEASILKDIIEINVQEKGVKSVKEKDFSIAYIFHAKLREILNGICLFALILLIVLQGRDVLWLGRINTHLPHNKLIISTFKKSVLNTCLKKHKSDITVEVTRKKNKTTVITNAMKDGATIKCINNFVKSELSKLDSSKTYDFKVRKNQSKKTKARQT